MKIFQAVVIVTRAICDGLSSPFQKERGRNLFLLLLGFSLFYSPYSHAVDYANTNTTYSGYLYPGYWNHVELPDEREYVAPVYQRVSPYWLRDYWGSNTDFDYGWYDPRSSENKYGLEGDGPRSFWLPKLHALDEVDLEAFDEQAYANSTPYAVGMLPYNIQWRKMKIDKGMHQFKLGQWNDGSLKTNLRKEDMRPKQSTIKQKKAEQGYIYDPSPNVPNEFASPPTEQSLEQARRLNKKMDVIVVTKGGKVEAVLPVVQVVDLNTQTWWRNFNSKRHPQWGNLGAVELFKARIDESYGRPVVAFNMNEVTGEVIVAVCQRNMCYESLTRHRDAYSYMASEKESKQPVTIYKDIQRNRVYTREVHEHPTDYFIPQPYSNYVSPYELPVSEIQAAPQNAGEDYWNPRKYK